VPRGATIRAHPSLTGDIPMSISMHAATAPIFTRMLGNLLHWLDKAQAHAEVRKFDTANYLGLRLAPDMLTFTKQVQIATDTAKRTMARLAGVEAPKYDDDETTLDQLRARVRKTLDFVASVEAAQLEGSDQREVLVPQGKGEPLKFTGLSFVQQFALPNFFFHVTTVYALLRSAGVEIGKGDYLGR
jgi:hypothetical protein